MEFADVLRKRRMVRGYREEPVPEEVLLRVLEAARRAPSAGFSQGQRLVVVTDDKRRRQAAEIAEGRYVDLGHAPWISQAPVHVYVCTRRDSYRERYGAAGDAEEAPWPVPFWWFDLGAVFVLLQLAAVDEGLATGFFSSVDAAELDALAQVAGLPDDLALVGVLTVGHPDPDAPAPVPANVFARLTLDQIVEWRG